MSVEAGLADGPLTQLRMGAVLQKLRQEVQPEMFHRSLLAARGRQQRLESHEGLVVAGEALEQNCAFDGILQHSRTNLGFKHVMFRSKYEGQAAVNT